MSNDSKKATHKPTPLLILASGSPRRMELVKALISEFDQVVPAVDELDFHPKGPGDMVLENALSKAGKVATEFPSCWVIGADTTVAIGNKSFGKPVDIVAARNMLQELSGKSHDVHTGMCLLNQSLQIIKKQVVTSRVTFLDLDDSRIEKYFSTVNPLDKAGAYAIQTNADLIVESFEGSKSNIIGLPVELLKKWLLEVGLI